MFNLSISTGKDSILGLSGNEDLDEVFNGMKINIVMIYKTTLKYAVDIQAQQESNRDSVKPKTKHLYDTIQKKIEMMVMSMLDLYNMPQFNVE